MVVWNISLRCVGIRFRFSNITKGHTSCCTVVCPSISTSTTLIAYTIGDNMASWLLVVRGGTALWYQGCGLGLGLSFITSHFFRGWCELL